MSTQHFLCSCPEIKRQSFNPNVSRDRQELILANNKKWVNGTVLKYYFFSSSNLGGNDREKDQVRKGFKEWRDLGIGLEFEEVSTKSDSIFRIGFKQGDGSWSYVGRDNWNISKRNRTMNFGWDILSSSGFDTVLHEIGHALGFPHEHQNPNAGIVWNRTNVINDLTQPPNSWTIRKIENNVLVPVRADESKGSDVDEDSIMMYPLNASWIDAPPHLSNGIDPEPGLSDNDKRWVKKFYPGAGTDTVPQLQLFMTKSFDIEPGAQVDFSFSPSATRNYTIRTFGELDTVMVLFEKSGSEEIYISADDDSGEDYNSSIIEELTSGTEYLIRVRLYSKWGQGITSIMVF